MAYGVTSQGFVQKTTEDILADIRTRQESSFGPGFLARIFTSVVGLLNAIFAALLAEGWQLAQNVYRSFYPDTAEGVALDNVAAISGAKRIAAKRSTVAVTIGGTIGTVVPSGTVFSVTGSGPRFRTISTVTIGPSFPVAVGVPCESEEYGQIAADASTLTVIETPVAGVSTVTNPLDAVLGNLPETDEAFRLRRDQELHSQGASVPMAIRADLLQVDGVTAVKVFLNKSDLTDADGLPPHSFECVVLGGADQDIRNTILNSEPAGIQSYGSTSGTAKDAEGVSQTVKFSRPTLKTVYIDIAVTTDALTYAGDASLKEALVNFGAAAFGFSRGTDQVIYNKIFQAAYGVSGVLEVTTLEIGFTASPSGTSNLALAQREMPTFDTSRVTVL